MALYYVGSYICKPLGCRCFSSSLLCLCVPAPLHLARFGRTTLLSARIHPSSHSSPSLLLPYSLPPYNPFPSTISDGNAYIDVICVLPARRLFDGVVVVAANSKNTRLTDTPSVIWLPARRQKAPQFGLAQLRTSSPCFYSVATRRRKCVKKRKQGKRGHRSRLDQRRRRRRSVKLRAERNNSLKKQHQL